MNIVSIGEILWDVFEKAEHIGGAPFNFSAHAVRLGHNIYFISAVGEDDRGKRALERMKEFSLSTQLICKTKETPTGHVTVFIDSAGQPSYTIHRPAAYDFPVLTEAKIQMINSLQPEWIYFGTLAQLSPKVLELTLKLLTSNPKAKRFYDINLRVGSYTQPLIHQLLSKASILKINEDEVKTIQHLFNDEKLSLKQFCYHYIEKFRLEGLCITRGNKGCIVFINKEYLEVSGYPIQVADAVGAGDAFAAAFIHGLSMKWSAFEIADFANRLGALVASRPGAIPSWTMKEVSTRI